MQTVTLDWPPKTQVPGEAMSLKESQVYHCQNRSCGSEILVTKASVEANANPRCCCGAEMKKLYTPPAFRLHGPDDELFNLFGVEPKLNS
jgi:hypothetical protein